MKHKDLLIQKPNLGASIDIPVRAIVSFEETQRGNVVEADLKTSKKRSKILMLTVIIQVVIVVVFVLKIWFESNG